MYRILLSILLYLISSGHVLIGQSASGGSFSFLDVPAHSFLAGLGGVNITQDDKDVNLFTSNPSLVGTALERNLSLSYILFPGDIKISNLSYAQEIGATGIWSAGLVYYNYGEMQGFDPTGMPTGEFSADEFAMTLGKSHTITNYRLGANMKFIYSGIAGYSASALVFDIGGVFVHPTSDFTVGMVIKSIGLVLNDYTEESNTSVPLNVQVGASFKPEHMPVRFSYTLYDLTDWSGVSEEAVSSGVTDPGGIEAFFRHSIVAAEFLIGQNVELLLGYDHRKRKELKLMNTSGSSGFSYGILIGVNAFHFGFSRFGYGSGGVSNTFTLTSNLGKWIKKKRVLE